MMAKPVFCTIPDSGLRGLIFLDNMLSVAENTAQDFIKNIKDGKSSDEIIQSVKDRYWHGYIKEIYPEDAINLNTRIMIELIKKELIQQEESK